MHKTGLVVAAAAIALAILVPLAVQGGKAGGSNVVKVDLRPPEAAWGTMHYNQEGCAIDFVFNAHGLDLEPDVVCELRFVAGTGNTGKNLLLYSGPDVVNNGGNAHIVGSVPLTWSFSGKAVRFRCGGVTVLHTNNTAEETYSFTYVPCE